MKHLLVGRRLIPAAAMALGLIWWVSAQNLLQVGYSVYSSDSGSPTPVGSAMFRVVDRSGVVISEAGVGAAESVRSARLFVDEVGTRMGVALVNANHAAASITFILRTSAGVEIARGDYSLGANQHLARYVAELFPAESAGLRGSLTFESSQPLAAVTLRENRNRRSEPLYTTLPVTNLLAAPSSESLIFPQIAVGGGFTTELLLMNPTAKAIAGEVLLYGSDGQPLSVLSGGQSLTRIAYTIAGAGTFRAALDGTTLVAGWAVGVPSAGNAAPSGSVIFQWKLNNQVVSEAGVAATTTTRIARIFIDNALGQTGVAIANPSNSTANLTLTLMDRNGNVEETQTRALIAGNHMAVYVNQLFSTVGEGFTGLMEIRSTVAIAPVTLKLAVNARGDLIMTTLPVADLARLPSTTTLIFPHIVIGTEFSTRLILINADTSITASGRLSFWQSDGNSMVVPMGSETGSQFFYRLSAGSGRQYYPGNSEPGWNPNFEILYGEPAISRVNPAKISARGGTITIQGSNFALDSLVVIADVRIDTASVEDSKTISVTIPPLSSGLTTLTVQNRGGQAQVSLLVDPVALDELLPGQITTVAGGATFVGDGSRATSAPGIFPAGLAIDAAGNLFLADRGNHRIRKVAAATGIITTVAGSGKRGFSGDDGPATAASLDELYGIAIDTAGNLFFTDALNETKTRIRKVDAVTGIITTVAEAKIFSFTGAIGVDAAGNVFIADFTHVYKVETATRIISTVAGNGEYGFSGDGGPATAASLYFPEGVAVDAAGNLFIADYENERIRKVSAATGIISTVAGGGPGPAGDGGPATAASLSHPIAIAVDAAGNLFISSNNRIRTVAAATGIITTVAGQYLPGFSGDGGPAIAASFSAPICIAVDLAGNLFISDSANYRIRKVAPATGIITTVAGTGLRELIGDGRTATAALLPVPRGIAVDTAGNLFISSSNRIRKVAAATGIITTVAGTGEYGFSGDGGPAIAASLGQPQRIAVDAAGNLFIADSFNQRIRKVTAATGIITTVAGSGTAGTSGDGGPATAASLWYPTAVAVDAAGNLFIVDEYSSRIRKVEAATGIITTVAGNGNGGFSGDGGPAIAASLGQTEGIAVDAAGNLFIAGAVRQTDIGISFTRVRKVEAATGIITTVAGGDQFGFSGDGGLATAASLALPEAVAVDTAGNLFIAEGLGPHRIRRVSSATGIITTIAGPGEADVLGDNGPATAAYVVSSDIAVDKAGNLLIADWVHNRIRAIRAPIP